MNRELPQVVQVAMMALLRITDLCSSKLVRALSPLPRGFTALGPELRMSGLRLVKGL